MVPQHDYRQARAASIRVAAETLLRKRHVLAQTELASLACAGAIPFASQPCGCASVVWLA
jgi:hypothetical protein